MNDVSPLRPDPQAAPPTPPPPTAFSGKYGIITTGKKELHKDEPLFLLRSTDPLAPTLCRMYAVLCKAYGCTPEHVAAAEACAVRMEGWQKANPELVKEKPG